MKKKSYKLQGLENFLPQLTQQHGWQEQLDLHSVFLHWEQLLDKEISKHCRPLKIMRGELWVEVENSAYLQQFQFQTRFFLNTLNKSLQLSKLKGIRFFVAEKDSQKSRQAEQTLHYVQPSPQEIKGFEQQVQSISDPEARDALLRFWYLAKACRVK